MPDDAELLRQYAESGSDQAFAAFVRGRTALVYSAAVRRTGGDAHLAQDVAQRVFLAAAQGAAKLSRHPYPTAWLYETTRFTASSIMRAEYRRRGRELTQSEEAQLTGDPDPPWEKLAPLLDEAIDRLHEGDRTAVLLRFFDGLSFPEIAGRLKLSDAGARLRVDRALDKLRRVLGRQGITSTIAGLALVLESKAIGVSSPGLASALCAGVTTASKFTVLQAGVTFSKTLSIMSATKAVVTAVVILSIGSAVYEMAQNHRAEAAVAALTLERDGLAKRVEAEAAEDTQLHTKIATLNRGRPNRIVGPGNQGVVKGHVAIDGIPLAQAEGIGALLRNPEYRKLQATVERGRLDARYAPLFKALGLSPDQLAAFKNLLIEKQLAATDAVGSARDMGITNPNETYQAAENAGSLVEGEIKTALGSADYAQYLQYQQTQPERDVVNQLQQSLSYSPSPLTDDQSSQLIEALGQASPEQSAKGNPTGTLVLMSNGLTNFITPGFTVTDQAVKAAESVLSPEQVQALVQIQSEQQAQRQLSLLSGGKPPP